MYFQNMLYLPYQKREFDYLTLELVITHYEFQANILKHDV